MYRKIKNQIQRWRIKAPPGVGSRPIPAGNGLDRRRRLRAGAADGAVHVEQPVHQHQHLRRRDGRIRPASSGATARSAGSAVRRRSNSAVASSSTIGSVTCSKFKEVSRVCRPPRKMGRSDRVALLESDAAGNQETGPRRAGFRGDSEIDYSTFNVLQHSTRRNASHRTNNETGNQAQCRMPHGR
jgi:hypothetical protein